ncbi:MAG: MFS transporter [Draconibacterium sp.]|nr:MAG: MFS transporter [Draconibacterium sp.]
MRTLNIENRADIEKIIDKCKTCYLAMSANGMPYVLPMNFALDGNNVVLHSAQSGRLWDTILKNPRVCINWTLGEELAWQNERVGCSYRIKSKSVIVEGEATIVSNYDEKYRLLHVFMKHYSDGDFNFNRPSVENVGIIRVAIEKISAKEFGAKAETPWRS